MTWSGAIVLVAVAFLVISMVKNWLNATLSFSITICLFLITGILSPSEALSGFANEQLAIIVLLVILGNVFKKLPSMGKVLSLMLRPNTSKQFLFKLVTLTSGFSSFLNNTPLVAILLPFIQKWGSKKWLSVSKVLIPLSYASILGGCTTLVGTSTNLIVNGMVVEAGLEPLGMFDFTAVGFVMLVIGISYLVIFSNRLPDNETVTNQFVENSRDFVIEMHVQPKSDVVGASVEAAGLRNLDGVYLIEIIRKSQNIYPVGPKEVIRANDVLLFAGNTERVRDLTEEHKGLSLPEACQLPEKDVDNIIEVVISQNSRLAGKKIKATNFRGKYDGVILGVHRNGERLRGKIGKIVLEPGDVLLVLAGKDFLKRMENNPHFYILSNQEEEKQIHSYKAVIFLLGLITAIGTAVLYDISLMVSLSVLLLLCMTLKMIKPSNIRNSIDFNLILIIGLGLALGKAMINSGAAKFITEKGFSMLQDINPWTVLIALFLITNALSSFITGKAAVAIIFPITLLISSKLGVEAKPLILAMTFGAAANFMTPIGYQTNLMVYGPGGYRFTDFFKMGLPLTLIYAFVTATILNYTYY